MTDQDSPENLLRTLVGLIYSVAVDRGWLSPRVGRSRDVGKSNQLTLFDWFANCE